MMASITAYPNQLFANTNTQILASDLLEQQSTALENVNPANDKEDRGQSKAASLIFPENLGKRVGFDG